ncbi:MAG: hypothetical protein DRI90_03065 [Deltaproteobacteria bacterium]|nr:MAG: hypothetical protein DRI90_03065 [Deltaproteobacteria bacterium]
MATPLDLRLKSRKADQRATDWDGPTAPAQQATSTKIGNIVNSSDIEFFLGLGDAILAIGFFFIVKTLREIRAAQSPATPHQPRR